MSVAFRWFLAVAIVVAAVRITPAAEIGLFDFERGGLGDDWSASGSLQAQRAALPAKATGDAKLLPQGSALSVSTAGKAGLFVRAGRVKQNWPDTETVSFWVYRSTDEAAKRGQSTIELQFYEHDGQSRFWRKIDVAHAGWQRFEAPLKWCRWGEGRIPAWENVDRFGFYFRDAAELTIDNVAVTSGGDDSALATAEDWQLLAFGPDAKVKVTRSERLLLLSDVTDLDAAALLTHLDRVYEDVLTTFSLPRPRRPISVIVFKQEDEYRDFPLKLGQKQNAAAARPTSGGYAVCGIATSYWDPRQGTLRPVFTHEFVHALLSHAARLDNRGDWLQEGAATHFQMKYHRQNDLNRLVAQGIADRAAHLPLDELCSGSRIPLNRYWQAMTVVETLLADEALAPKFPALMKAVSTSGNTDLRSQIEPALASDWPTLTTRWKTYCERNYAAP